MCRITGVTSVNFRIAMKPFIFHQTMLYSVADGAQNDGVGMSDGHKLIKSAYSYQQIGLEWIRELDLDSIWLGHVRRHSQSTVASATLASHPYEFANKGNRLIGVHNGFVKNTPVPKKDEPNTDSFQALLSLATMLDGADLTPELIIKWTDTFGEGSEYAFALMQKDKLYMVRGNRPLAQMQVNNDGYVINTSADVLDRLSACIHTFFSRVVPIGEIEELQEYSIRVYTAGSLEYDHITYRPLPKRTERSFVYRSDAEGKVVYQQLV